MRRAGLRDGSCLLVREIGRSAEELRLPLRAGDSPAPRRARADAEAAFDWQDRPTAVRVGPHAAAFRCLPGAPARRKNRFRVREEEPGTTRGGRRGAAALRVLGPHPKDNQPVELHAGRYGPYVKHGGINATLPDRERIDAVTLSEAVALLAAKATKAKPAPPKKAAKPAKAATRKRAS